MLSTCISNIFPLLWDNFINEQLQKPLKQARGKWKVKNVNEDKMRSNLWAEQKLVKEEIIR